MTSGFTTLCSTMISQISPAPAMAITTSRQLQAAATRLPSGSSDVAFTV